MEPVIAKADEMLAAQDAQPLPEGVTAHKLRHTAASILAALNWPMPDVIAQLGHPDPFTLRVYAHTMRRDEHDLERLRALVEGRDWEETGRIDAEPTLPRNVAQRYEHEKAPR